MLKNWTILHGDAFCPYADTPGLSVGEWRDSVRNRGIHDTVIV